MAASPTVNDSCEVLAPAEDVPISAVAATAATIARRFMTLPSMEVERGTLPAPAPLHTPHDSAARCVCSRRGPLGPDLVVRVLVVREHPAFGDHPVGEAKNCHEIPPAGL